MNPRDYEILERYSRGHSLTEIGKFYNLSKQRIKKIVQEFGTLKEELDRAKHRYFDGSKKHDSDYKLAERLDELTTN